MLHYFSPSNGASHTDDEGEARRSRHILSLALGKLGFYYLYVPRVSIALANLRKIEEGLMDCKISLYQLTDLGSRDGGVAPSQVAIDEKLSDSATTQEFQHRFNKAQYKTEECRGEIRGHSKSKVVQTQRGRDTLLDISRLQKEVERLRDDIYVVLSEQPRHAATSTLSRAPMAPATKLLPRVGQQRMRSLLIHEATNELGDADPESIAYRPGKD